MDVTAARDAATAAVTGALSPLLDIQAAQLVKTAAAQQQVSDVLDELEKCTSGISIARH